MAQEIQLRFDYELLDAETRVFVLERAERIHNLARMTAAGIVQIGQYLTEVKERLQLHNQGRSRDNQERLGFLKWIDLEFAWKQAQAYRFIQVYENVKVINLINLEIDVSALYLIAAPSTPEPIRQEVLRRAENGQPVTHAGARALVERFAETGEIPTVDTDLATLIAERRERVAPEKSSAEERQEERRRREECAANTTRIATVMGVIRSIECIADTALTMPEIAYEIERLDTPDQDWRGEVKEAYTRLRKLSEELKL